MSVIEMRGNCSYCRAQNIAVICAVVDSVADDPIFVGLACPRCVLTRSAVGIDRSNPASGYVFRLARHMDCSDRVPNVIDIASARKRKNDGN